MTTLFAVEFFAIAVALFLIAYGVLRLPARTPAPAYQEPAQKPDVFRRDIAYINVNRKGAGVDYRRAYNDGYRAVARDGDWLTMKRNGE